VREDGGEIREGKKTSAFIVGKDKSAKKGENKLSILQMVAPEIQKGG